jgi:hypothetical protein
MDDEVEVISMNINNKNRIDILKRKNRRNILIKKLSKNFEVSMDSFLDIDENDSFCKKIFDKLDAFGNKNILQGNDFKENIELAKERLTKVIKEISFNNNFARILFYGEMEIEAVKLNVQEIINNIERILEITRFLDGYGDFILVEEDLKLGVCIERNEHYYELCLWGVSN